MNNQEEIKKKGFSMFEAQNDYVDFSRVRIGAKMLDDAILNLGSLNKVNSNLTDKTMILTALANRDYETLRNVSNFYYETSGIYSRLTTYFATLFKYDTMVTPYVTGNVTNDKVLAEYAKVLKYIDSFCPKKKFGDIALKVLKDGCFYGYLIDQGAKPVIQELPIKYCRSRFFSNDKPVIEFNMKYFDDQFRDTEQRMMVLKLFPKEFSKGYILYKSGKLPAQFSGDSPGWYMLDPEFGLKFNLNGCDYPVLVNIVPGIISLDEAQDLDKKKTMQQLLKILIQRMPFDKNGELVFDVDEAKDLHNNAVNMLSNKAVGLDVLTTFAETEMIDLADKNSSTSKDDLLKVERALYNQAGASQGLFNTDGNLALEKSVANDEAFMYGLVLQFKEMLNNCIGKFNKNKKMEFSVNILPTSIYNYKDLSKLYKEQATLGYSKFLPQVALGISQSSILADAHFENEILNMSELMVPAQSSNTMSGKNSNQSVKANSGESEGTVGRQTLPDDQKSEKTIRNQEAMG